MLQSIWDVLSKILYVMKVSCTDYVDCREGQPFQMSCGHGAVFDESLGCVHPDQTNRFSYSIRLFRILHLFKRSLTDVPTPVVYLEK